MKLSKNVLARREFRVDLATLEGESFRLGDLIELYGENARLEREFYHDEVNIVVFKMRLENDDEYNARIEAEESKQRKAAATRARNKAKTDQEKRDAENRANDDERKLYEKLKKKFG